MTLLHPPYTLWHLSYVAVGAALAPHFHLDRLLWAIVAFFLAMGVAAHALDELNGRPLRTRDPVDRARRVAAFVALAGAIGVGIAAANAWGWWLLAFVAVGAVARPAYNLELFGGVLHNDWGFALALGRVPGADRLVRRGADPRFEAFAVAGYATALSLAQRALSTPARRARRDAGHGRGNRDDRARVASAHVRHDAARRRSRGGAPTMNGMTIAVIVAVAAACAGALALVACVLTLRKVRDEQGSLTREIERGKAEFDEVVDARARAAERRARADARARCGPTSLSQLAEEERRIAEERRRDVAERERDATDDASASSSLAVQAAVEQRLADWAGDVEKLQGGLDRRAEAARGAAAPADGRDRSAKLEQDAEGLKGQIDEQRQTVARLAPGSRASGARRSSSSATHELEQHARRTPAGAARGRRAAAQARDASCRR